MYQMISAPKITQSPISPLVFTVYSDMQGSECWASEYKQCKVFALKYIMHKYEQAVTIYCCPLVGSAAGDRNRLQELK